MTTAAQLYADYCDWRDAHRPGVGVLTPDDLAAAVGRIRLLSRTAQAVDLALERDDQLIKLLQIGSYPNPAAGAGVVSLRLELSDTGAALVAAFRAGQFDLLVLDQVLQHISSPVDVCTNREPRPGGSRDGGIAGADGAEPGGQP